MRRFAGRVAFVVGGGHGIGRASARRLAQEGSAVVVADLDTEAAQAVADELNGEGATSFATRCDLLDSASVDQAVAGCVARTGRLDVLVNAAGGNQGQPDFPASSDETWSAMVDLNLTGVVRCIRAALPHLLAAPGGGRVVSVSSVNAMTALGNEAYSAAKAGLQNLTINLAARYGPQGVRFNVIAPATIRTRVWDQQPGALERLTKLYPLGRVGEPEDVAAAVAFLASDDAAWITGVVLPVDGGVLAAGVFRNRSQD